jgi:DNA invertase Pin-like site-specific DNA recombinase
MMTNTTDEMTDRMMDALNSMMLDMLAAIARKDYTDRRRRQQQGIEKLKTGGAKRRKEDVQRNEATMTILRRGDSWSHVIAATGCSGSPFTSVSGRP